MKQMIVLTLCLFIVAFECAMAEARPTHWNKTAASAQPAAAAADPNTFSLPAGFANFFNSFGSNVPTSGSTPTVSGWPSFGSFPAVGSLPSGGLNSTGLDGATACLQKAFDIQKISAGIQTCIPTSGANLSNQQDADALRTCLQNAIPDPQTTQATLQKCVTDAIAGLANFR